MFTYTYIINSSKEKNRTYMIYEISRKKNDWKYKRLRKLKDKDQILILLEKILYKYIKMHYIK